MAAVATTTSAEGSVLQVFLFPSGATAGPDASDVYGSVLGSSPEATTIALGCKDSEAIDFETADYPLCLLYAGLTVTNGPSTYHAATGCAPEATVCVEIDCKITGTTKATCLETTVAPKMLLLPEDEFMSLFGTAGVYTSDSSALQEIGTTTRTLEIPPGQMPYHDVTLMPLLPTPYVSNSDNSSSMTEELIGLVTPSSAADEKETASPGTATTSTSAPVSSITGESGAGNALLGLSGGLAGAAVAVMALL